METNTPDTGIPASYARALRRTVEPFLTYVPNGKSTPEEIWWSRHRQILVVLVAHAPFRFALGTFTGTDPYVTGTEFTAVPLAHAVVGVGFLLVFTLLAWWPRLPRCVRAATTAVALMTASGSVSGPCRSRGFSPRSSAIE